MQIIFYERPKYMINSRTDYNWLSHVCPLSKRALSYIYLRSLWDMRFLTNTLPIIKKTTLAHFSKYYILKIKFISKLNITKVYKKLRTHHKY